CPQRRFWTCGVGTRTDALLLFERRQQERMLCSANHAIANNLAAIVDACGLRQCPTRSQVNQRIQVGDDAVAPNEGALDAARNGRKTDDFLLVIDACRVT